MSSPLLGHRRHHVLGGWFRDVTAVRPLLVTGGIHRLAFTTALGLVCAAHETTRGGEVVDLSCPAASSPASAAS
jgi:hypothetical protein